MDDFSSVHCMKPAHHRTPLCVIVILGSRHRELCYVHLILHNAIIHTSKANQLQI